MPVELIMGIQNFEVGPDTTPEAATQACRDGRRLIICKGAPQMLVDKLLAIWVAPRLAEIWQDQRGAEAHQDGYVCIPAHSVVVPVAAKIKIPAKIITPKAS